MEFHLQALLHFKVYAMVAKRVIHSSLKILENDNVVKADCGFQVVKTLFFFVNYKHLQVHDKESDNKKEVQKNK